MHRRPSERAPCPRSPTIDQLRQFHLQSRALSRRIGGRCVGMAQRRDFRRRSAGRQAGRDRAVARTRHARTRPASASTWCARGERVETPILGVCLGHQAIGQGVRRQGGAWALADARQTASRISHNARGVFRGINGPFQATRYHSLIVDRKTAPPALEVTAETEDGLFMGVSHRALPIHGVQFHPEEHSFGTRRAYSAKFSRSCACVQRRGKRPLGE